MKTYKSQETIIKCYPNTKGDRFFIKIVDPKYTAKFEFTSKASANEWFKNNMQAFPNLKIKVR